MMRRGGGGGSRRAGASSCTPRLSKRQRENLVTALILSLALLLCLQVCLFLPLLVDFRGSAWAVDELLALSNGGAPPHDEPSPWAKFHRLPRVSGWIPYVCRCCSSHPDETHIHWIDPPLRPFHRRACSFIPCLPPF